MIQGRFSKDFAFPCRFSENLRTVLKATVWETLLLQSRQTPHLNSRPRQHLEAEEGIQFDK